MRWLKTVWSSVDFIVGPLFSECRRRLNFIVWSFGYGLVSCLLNSGLAREYTQIVWVEIWGLDWLIVLHYISPPLLATRKPTCCSFLFWHSNLCLRFSWLTILSWCTMCVLDEEVVGSDSISDIHIIIDFWCSWRNRSLIFFMALFSLWRLTIKSSDCVILSAWWDTRVLSREILVLFCRYLLWDQTRGSVVFLCLCVCYAWAISTYIGSP